MRYYRIDLSRTDGTPVYLRSLNQPLTSLAPNGIFNPGALQVELDIPVNPFSTGDATSGYIKVWGVGLQDITHQADYNGLNIAVYGGMSAGLPLANPNQAGLLVQGSIQQAYGNWVGVEQSIVFIVGPSTGLPQQPKNFPFVWQAGTPLATALASLFNAAFPGQKQNITISPNLTIGYTETGYYQNLKQFADWLNQRTIPIIGGNYQGVQIAFNGNGITVWDGMQAPSNVTQVNPWDLIGQPTWLDPVTINFQVVMRGNVNLGDTVQLPQTIIQQIATSQLYLLKNQTTFNGKVVVTKAQHFGNFRQPDPASWITSFWTTPATT